jgi:hypothetical protein
MDATPSEAARIVARVDHYSAWLCMVRDRLKELEITHETLDLIAGLQRGYSSKLLAQPPIKRAGPFVMFIVQDALGLTSHVIEDPTKIAIVRDRLQKRTYRQHKQFHERAGNGVVVHFTRDQMRIAGAKGARAGWAKLSPAERSRVMRARALKRWSSNHV